MARRRRTWNGMRWATTEPFSRLAAWLGQLLHIILAELSAQLCSESPALQAAAEECIAAHNPPPLEMAERVLLSPDLMPFILGQLLAEDGTVAAVCSHWLAVWEATKLKQVPLDFPVDAIRTEPYERNPYVTLGMAATPDGRLLVIASNKLYTLDRSMRVLQMREFALVRPHPILAAIDDSTVIIGQDSPRWLDQWLYEPHVARCGDMRPHRALLGSWMFDPNKPVPAAPLDAPRPVRVAEIDELVAARMRSKGFADHPPPPPPPTPAGEWSAEDTARFKEWEDRTDAWYKLHRSVEEQVLGELPSSWRFFNPSTGRMRPEARHLSGLTEAERRARTLPSEDKNDRRAELEAQLAALEGRAATRLQAGWLARRSR